MKTIALFGAGKSATVLIEYLINEGKKNLWFLIVADNDKQLIESKTKNAINTRAVQLDINDKEKRQKIIQMASIVISMMPPHLHLLIAQDCILFKKNLLTASYISKEIAALEPEIKKNELLFIGELGLDPGIDHISAMPFFHSIQQKGGKITCFKSHCGGLIAPESDTNPWHYKVSWNPRNIVLAGNSGAIYRQNNETKIVPYEHVFDNCDTIKIDTLESLAWYANRDSLSYIPVYQLTETKTFIRTTLRHPSFCRGWNKLIQMGLTHTDDEEKIKDCKTFSEWFHRKIYFAEKKMMSWHEYLHSCVPESQQEEFKQQVEFLGLLDEVELPNHLSSADILQYLIETKLKMEPHDKDMIVMFHEIEYFIENEKHKVESSLIVKGEDSVHTAMAKTVGLPLGITAKLILQGKINLTGLYIPILPAIYEPVALELEKNGIVFNENAFPLL